MGHRDSLSMVAILTSPELEVINMQFIMLINVKMPTIVEHLKARKVFIFKHCRFFEHLKYHAQLS